MKKIPKFCKSAGCPKHEWDFCLRIRSTNTNYYECVPTKMAKFLFTDHNIKECWYITYFGKLRYLDKVKSINSEELLKILCAWKKYIEKRSHICLTKT